MKLGITGTRTWITDKQRAWMETFISIAEEVHHGACSGADEAAHICALETGGDSPSPTIVVHPPHDTKYMMTPNWNHPNIIVRPPLYYHPRNRRVVNETDWLAAFPNTGRRPHSGTWYTIDYAIARHKPVDVFYPDGRWVAIRNGVMVPAGEYVVSVGKEFCKNTTSEDFPAPTHNELREHYDNTSLTTEIAEAELNTEVVDSPVVGITVKLHAELLQKVREAAAAEGLRTTAIIRRWIEERLASQTTWPRTLANFSKLQKPCAGCSHPEWDHWVYTITGSITACDSGGCRCKRFVAP